MASTLADTALEIGSKIVSVRGQRVLLDEHLAELYGVGLSAFNQAVRRNRLRFPTDFLFQLTSEEWPSLRSQFVILERGRGRYRKYLPLAFTEHGATMAATILNSSRAVEISVYVVRAFVWLRKSLGTHAELVKELNALRISVANHDTDTQRKFDVVYEAILGLMGPANRKQ